MKILSRLAALIVVFPVTYYLFYLASAGILYWIAANSIDESTQHWICIALSPVAAGFATWISWKNVPAIVPQVLGIYILLGGLLIGGVGFVGGAYGPIFLGDQNLSASLLGILITGPLGFIIGAFVGGIIWGIQRRKLVE